MPWGDGTGPRGLGPMTGRAAGYCAGFSAPGYVNSYPGRANWGRGAFGRGRGFRNMYYATGLPGWYRARMGLPAFGAAPAAPVQAVQPTKSEETQYLKQEISAMEEERKSLAKDLEELKKRLAELGKKQ